MKKIKILLLFSMLLIFSSKSIYAREAVTIKDPLLEKQILSSLKSKNEKHRKMENIKLSDPDYIKDPNEDRIFKDELELFTHFRSDDQIADLSGLEYMKNLKTLKIFRNSSIRDISPLRDLIGLQHLWLNNNQISDVGPIRNLVNLEVLRLENNKIKDIGPIAEMVRANNKLYRLSLYGNEIEDFSGLKDKNFKYDFKAFMAYEERISIKPDSSKFFLNLKDKDGKIYDISDPNVALVDKFKKNSDGSYSFKGDPENIELRIFADGFTLKPMWIVNIDATNMANDENRERIEFKSKDLEDEILNILKNPDTRTDKEVSLIDDSYVKKADETFVYRDEMEMFKSLTLVGNSKIKYLDGLDKAINLESLKLFENDIRDLGPLAGLSKLKLLNLDSNKQIQEISALAGLENLEDLSMIDCNIGYIGALENLTRLKTLNLDHNNIDNIEALKKLTDLTTLHMDENLIKDISVLKNLDKLTSLSLKANEISDVSPLKDIRNLSYLGLSKNRIADFSSLGNIFNEISKVFAHEGQEIHIYPNTKEFNIILKDEYGKSYKIDSKQLSMTEDGKYFYPKDFVELGFDVIDDYYSKKPSKNKKTWHVFIHPDNLLEEKEENKKKEFSNLKEENDYLKGKVKEYENKLGNLEEKMVKLETEAAELKNNKQNYSHSGSPIYLLPSKTESDKGKKLDEDKKEVKVLSKRVFTLGQPEFKEYNNSGEKIVKMEAAPYIKNDRIMLPIRYVAESLGANASWNDKTKMVVLKKGETIVLIEENSQIAILSNGDKIELDAPAENIKGRVFIPLSNINKIFGGNIKINWDDQTKSAIVN